MTLDEVKSGYLSKLEKAGFTKNQFTEDSLQYALIGYEKEGTVLVFKTSSLKEMQKFLNVKALGVTRSETNLETELSDDQMASYAKVAFDNPKSQATAMANTIGRKVGKAVYISDSNNKKIKQSLYNSADIKSRDYHITVSFELL